MANEPGALRPPLLLPVEPVHRIVRPLARFLHIEAASGVVLLIATAAALILANSAVGEEFLHFWEIPIGIEVGAFQMQHSLHHWINDGLMVIFFFVIGLEVKRELVLGELRDLRRAALPIAAAIGGMVMPAGIYLALQFGQPGERGWGIPMATDIAFVVGCMALLGTRVPHGLRIMLLSLAIADDIGAILVIAIGYTESLNLTALLLGLVGIGVIFGFARLGVRSLLVYTVLGMLVWLAFHTSGVHATIAGVILGLMTPARSYLSEGLVADWFNWARDIFHGGGWATNSQRAATIRQFRRFARETISPLEYLEATLHPWVGFVIMPIFALANAGVVIKPDYLGAPVAVAVMLGLLLGKPLGILLASWLSVKTGLARLPTGVGWGAMAGAGCLAGIGFTMALFIANLALKGELLDSAKIGILSGSILSAMVGMILLLILLPRPGSAADEETAQAQEA